MNINDNDFKNSDIYKKFIEENPSTGSLSIRAYTAKEAIPISGLKIIVSKIIDNINVIFFEGETNESGVIEKIKLPAPKLESDNMDIPKKTSYDIVVKDDISKKYKVNMYENICVIQIINIMPNMNLGGL